MEHVSFFGGVVGMFDVISRKGMRKNQVSTTYHSPKILDNPTHREVTNNGYVSKS